MHMHASAESHAAHGCSAQAYRNHSQVSKRVGKSLRTASVCSDIR